MRIALLRHGIAGAGSGADFDRELTSEGWLELEQVLDGLQRARFAPGAILHSPFVRTTQTAASAHARYPDVPLLAVDELALPSLEAITMVAARHPDPLLVGHEPTLGNLCARLLGAPSGGVRFERAGFALLEVDRLPATRPARLLAFFAPSWIVGG
jgi:phosphohistidine phosphatase